MTVLTNCSLNARPCGPDSNQHGFTLLEMLVALAVVAMLSMAAQPMLTVSFRQIHQMVHLAGAQDDGLPETLQWLENDVLQLRGDLPWQWEGTLDTNSCLIRWRFTTENKVLTQSRGLAEESVQYRVANQTLYRETFVAEELTRSSPLLKGVTCLHPRFWQRQQWRERPLPKVSINALALSIHWSGPQVERVWPVNITYDP